MTSLSDISDSLPKEIKMLMQSQKEWVELFPLAVTMSPGPQRPLLILQDKEKKMSLPVWLGSLDAAVAMVQSNPGSVESTPHKTTLQILKALNVELTYCLFIEVVGHQQYVELCFKTPTGMMHVRCRADESMSLCLLSHARFYGSTELIHKSREVQVRLGETPIPKAPASQLLN